MLDHVIYLLLSYIIFGLFCFTTSTARYMCIEGLYFMSPWWAIITASSLFPSSTHLATGSKFEMAQYIQAYQLVYQINISFSLSYSAISTSNIFKYKVSIFISNFISILFIHCSSNHLLILCQINNQEKKIRNRRRAYKVRRVMKSRALFVYKILRT